jgi:hypothetical protein
MPCAATPEFRCKPLAELVPTWLSLRADRRRGMLQRAEQLHDQLDADTAYPFAFIAFRLTGYRRDHGDDSLLVGEALLPDLRTLIDRLSKTLELPPQDGRAVTADQLAAQLNVSTKTLSRWRKDGLRWRWITPLPGARPVIGFTAEAVERYRATRPQRVAKASSFSQLTDAQRDDVLRRARRLAATTDASFNQIADHLAKRTGRALETIRLILEKHDRDHPDEPIFADRTGPLTPRQKRLIGRAHRIGVPVGKLAERFRRSRATIHRVILDRRAARALRLPLDHVPHPQFDRPDAAEIYLRKNLAPDAAAANARPSAVPVDHLPDELRELYVQPVVSPDKVRSLFLRYNFLKHRARAARQHFEHAPAKARDLDTFERDLAMAARVRSLLVTWHLPVVLSVARRHLVGKPHAGPTRLIELLELGNPVLIDTVEGYDASHRPTFESVLTNRLLRAFAASAATHSVNAKARRRVNAAEVMQRMINLADESGVHLAITEPPEAAEAASPE